jgi:ubiquinone/menaquinone biosynthesis C-methylase UbiE
MFMDQDKSTKIKEAVKANFDASPTFYQDFESRYGFFRMLNSVLLRKIELPGNADILDVGCGTGASCLQMLEFLPQSRVWGLDNSQAMLESARAAIGESERLTFVEGDAARLRDYFSFPFDAVIYSASVFLIPDYRESLRHARDLLKDGGRVGFTFMDGLYDAEGDNLFARAAEAANEKISLRKPVKWSEFEAFLRELFPRHRVWHEDFILPDDLLRSFFAVPAMSAGLFPGIEYSERLRKIARVFDHMPTTEILFRWMLVVGEKEAMPA